MATNPFAAWRDELRRKVPDLVRNVAEDMAENMRHSAPVLSGNLKGSVTVTASGDAITVAAEDEAAPHVEFGTIDTPAQPFFVPAVRQARKRLRRDLEKIISEAGRTLT